MRPLFRPATLLLRNQNPAPTTKFLRRFSADTIPPKKQKWIPTSGTYPKGFRIGSTHVGMKPISTAQPDLVLVTSDLPSCGAAVFTRNEFPAASIIVSKNILRTTKGHGIQGVIANSWCANLLTGQPGLDDATVMSKEAAKLMSRATDSQPSSVMVMHTGHAVTRICASIPQLHEGAGNSHKQWLEAATGICTGDTFPKLVSRTFTLPSSPGITFTIAGITKGAGMIHPNMATTLGIICTDAPVTPAALQQLLSTSASKSYNCISVDGDTSTNDMVVMLANGAAHGSTVDLSSADFDSMQLMLDRFMADMAKLVVRDGDGASKFLTIRVRGSPIPAAAKHIASAISRSMLLKTALYGKHPVWKDIVSTLGYSLLDTEFDGQGVIKREMTSVSFVIPDDSGELKFLDRGNPIPVDETEVRRIMEQEEIEIILDLRDNGDAKSSVTEEAVYWTCDLTHEFVSINMA